LNFFYFYFLNFIGIKDTYYIFPIDGDIPTETTGNLYYCNDLAKCSQKKDIGNYVVSDTEAYICTDENSCSLLILESQCTSSTIGKLYVIDKTVKMCFDSDINNDGVASTNGMFKNTKKNKKRIIKIYISIIMISI